MSELNIADMQQGISKNASYLGKVNVELTESQLMNQTLGTAKDIGEQQLEDGFREAKNRFAANGDPVDKLTTWASNITADHENSDREKAINAKKEELKKAMENLPIKYWPVVDHVLQDIYDRPSQATGHDQGIKERHLRMLKAYDLVSEQIKDGSFANAVDAATAHSPSSDMQR
jgi:hypothetical protein